LGHAALAVENGGDAGRTVSDAQIASVTAAHLAIVRSYDDDWIAASHGQWWGDDLMNAAPAAMATDGGDGSGVNLLWIDALGNVQAEQVGATAILQERGPVIRTVAVAPASITNTSGRWDIAWIESTPSGGEALYFNELDCQ
jgi:hypothetical protein